MQLWQATLDLALTGALILSVFVTTYRSTISEHVIEFKSTERVGKKYLVFTEDLTYQNTDVFWFVKFNSSDLYSKLQKPGKYKVKTVGFRLPLFSTYKNIIIATSCVEVSSACE